MSAMVMALAVVAGAALVTVAVLLIRRPLAAIALVPLAAGLGPRELTALPGALNWVHPLALVAVGCTLIHVLTTSTARQPLRRTSARVAVGAATCLGALVAVSALAGPFFVTYLGTTVTTLLAIAYGGCVVLVVRSVDDVRLLLSAFVIGSLGVTAPALLQAGGVQSQFSGAVVEGRATGGFADPNELGLYSALVVVAAVVHLATGTGRVRWATATAGVVAMAALLLSFSRLSWIAASVGLLVLAGHSYYRRLLVRRVAPALAAGAVLAFLLGVRFPVATVVERAQSFAGAVNPSDERPLIWQESLRVFMERPVLGWGPGAFKSLSATPPSALFADPVEHSHNGFLVVLVEQGALGGLAFLALVAALGWGLVSTYVTAARRARACGDKGAAQRHDRPGASRTALLAWGLAALSVTLGVNLTGDYALRNAFLMILVWFLVGLLAAFDARATSEHTHQDERAGPAPGGRNIWAHAQEER